MILRSLIVLMFVPVLNVSAQGGANLKKQNEESIALLRAKIEALENSESLQEEETVEVTKASILAFKDTIYILQQELETCAASNEQLTTVKNTTISTQRESQLFFNRDIYKLTMDAKSILNSFAKSLPDSYNFIVIQGHADAVGSDSQNNRISKKRAESIRQYLIEAHGVQPDKILLNWMGSKSPGADTSTTEDDRRCDIKVI